MIACETNAASALLMAELYSGSTKEAMKTISLTQGQITIVDDHWYDYLSQWEWNARWNEHTQSYYADRREGKERIQMSRVVAKTPKGMICDHIHHNTLDNRESELRNVTTSQNVTNRRLQKNNKLGITGIHKRVDSGKYRAKLKSQGRMVLNKTFLTLDEAVAARKEAEQKYFGEFAYVGGK